MNKIFFVTFLVFFLIGTSFCKVEGDKFTSTEVEEIEFWKSIIVDEVHEKCMNTTGNDADAVNFLAAVERVANCAYEHVNITALGVDIHHAIENEVYEGIFNHSCHKADEVFQCVSAEQQFFDTCLTADEVVEKNSVFGVVKKVVEYFCGANGDVFTAFISGFDCFEQKKTELYDCAENVFGNATDIQTKITTSSYDNTENCSGLTNLQNCVIPILETCDVEKIPATMTNGLFVVVLQELKCPKKSVSDTDVTNEI